MAVSVCGKLYGHEQATYQTALAHQALAKALLANHQLADHEYYDHALKAWRCAMDCIEGDHPRLAQFRYTLGMAFIEHAFLFVGG